MHQEDDNYSREDALMVEIDTIESFHIQKMNMLRNQKYIMEADVKFLINDLWYDMGEKNLNYRYIWACWVEEQEEINSNGW